MDNNTRNTLISYLSDIKLRYRNELSRLNQLTGYESTRLKVKSSENGNDYYYLYSTETNKFNYIGKSTNAEVLKIKEAHYLQRSTCQLEREINSIEKLLSQCVRSSYDDINQRMPKAYKGALINQVPAPSIQLANWKNEMEKRKAGFPPFRPHELIHRTRDGTMVRSKSEAMIADALFDAGLRFKSETGVVINRAMGGGERKVYPDFEILHPKTHELVWWEHLGRADDGSYMQGSLEKLEEYGDAGINLGKNLIITSETIDAPLTRGARVAFCLIHAGRSNVHVSVRAGTSIHMAA